MASTIEAVVDEPVVVVRAKSLTGLTVFVAILSVVFLLTVAAFGLLFLAGQARDARQRDSLCGQVQNLGDRFTNALVRAGGAPPAEGTPERDDYDARLKQFREDTAVNCNL